MSVFLSVVIPAFNESQNIAPTIQELEAVIGKSSEVSDYEIIVVDDHSSDGTFQKAASLHERNSRIHALRLSRQSGSHIALRAGIAQAKGDAVLFVAADGQDDPNLLNEMLVKIREGHHVVWAIRAKRETNWFYNRIVGLAYRLISLLVPSMPLDRHLSGADFFMISREFKEALNACKEHYTSIFGLMTWAGFKHSSISYERRPRLSGESKWKFRSKWRLMTDWIAAFSGIPLKITSMVGALLTGAGLAGGGILLYLFFGGRPIPGWVLVSELMILLAGLQMFFLGIAGEYLWRNLEESRRRPLFFIEAFTGDPLSAQRPYAESQRPYPLS